MNYLLLMNASLPSPINEKKIPQMYEKGSFQLLLGMFSKGHQTGG
jgi:hypothetical protein